MARYTFGYIGLPRTSCLGHLVEQSATGVVLLIQEPSAEAECPQLDDAGKHPHIHIHISGSRTYLDSHDCLGFVLLIMFVSLLAFLVFFSFLSFLLKWHLRHTASKVNSLLR